jgi:hypothetical protein
MAVVGEREAEAGTVAVRKRGAGKKQQVMSREDFLQELLEEIRSRALAQAPEGDTLGSPGAHPGLKAGLKPGLKPVG